MRAKALPEWFDAIWVGRSTNPNEHLLLTDHGVVKTRTVRRTPEAQQWNPQILDQSMGLPWQVSGESAAPAAAPAEAPPASEPDFNETEIQRFYREVGRTLGCSACAGMRSYHHNRLCLDRRKAWSSGGGASSSLGEPAIATSTPPPVPQSQASSSTQPMQVDPPQQRTRTAEEADVGDSPDDERAHKYQTISVVDEKFVVVEDRKLTSYELPTEELTLPDLDMDEVRAVAAKEGMGPTEVEKGIERELKSFVSFGVMKVIEPEEVPDGTHVLGTALVLKPRTAEKGGGVKARICAQDFATENVKTRLPPLRM